MVSRLDRHPASSMGPTKPTPNGMKHHWFVRPSPRESKKFSVSSGPPNVCSLSLSLSALRCITDGELLISIPDHSAVTHPLFFRRYMTYSIIYLLLNVYWVITTIFRGIRGHGDPPVSSLDPVQLRPTAGRNGERHVHVA